MTKLPAYILSDPNWSKTSQSSTIFPFNVKFLQNYTNYILMHSCLYFSCLGHLNWGHREDSLTLRLTKILEEVCRRFLFVFWLDIFNFLPQNQPCPPCSAPLETNIPMAFMSPSVTKLLLSSDMLTHFAGREGRVEIVVIIIIIITKPHTQTHRSDHAMPGETGAWKHEGNDLTNWKGLRSPISIESLLV